MFNNVQGQNFLVLNFHVPQTSSPLTADFSVVGPELHSDLERPGGCNCDTPSQWHAMRPSSLSMDMERKEKILLKGKSKLWNRTYTAILYNGENKIVIFVIVCICVKRHWGHTRAVWKTSCHKWFYFSYYVTCIH